MLKLYTKVNCTNCVQAKLMLDLNEIPYQVHDVFDYEEILTDLRAKGAREMPQAYLDEEHLGGFEAIRKYIKSYKEA